MKKQEILFELANALEQLNAMLSLDATSKWAGLFRHAAEVAKQMSDLPFDPSESARFSASIRHVFGGVGSFNDYEPMQFDPSSGRYITINGTEGFDALRRKVYELATALIEQ